MKPKEIRAVPPDAVNAAEFTMAKSDPPTAVIAHLAELEPSEWPDALLNAGVSADRIDNLIEYFYLLEDFVRASDSVDDDVAQATIAAAGRTITEFGADCDELSRRRMAEHFDFARQEAQLSQEHSE